MTYKYLYFTYTNSIILTQISYDISLKTDKTVRLNFIHRILVY